MFGTDYYRVTITCDGEPVPFVMAPQEPTYQKYRTLFEICETVANHFHIPSHSIRRNTRDKRSTKARQIAMWIAKEITLQSLPAIGRYLGRDHTTVLHGIRKIEELRTRFDHELADDLEAIIKKLGGRP